MEVDLHSSIWLYGLNRDNFCLLNFTLLNCDMWYMHDILLPDLADIMNSKGNWYSYMYLYILLYF
jgi:hypothetical protein